MPTSRWTIWALAMTSGAAFLLASQSALACATCYNNALGPKGIQAIKSGILILLLPTIAIFGALMLLTFRYRNSCPSWGRAIPEQGPPQPSRLDLLALPGDEPDSEPLRSRQPGILPAR